MEGKRVIAVLCSIFLVLGLIVSGCASKTNEVPGNTDQTTTAEANGAGEDEQTADQGVARSEVPLALSVEVFDRGDAPAGSTAENNPITEWIIKEVKEKTNVDVTFVAVPRAQQYDKLNIMLASNTAPDIAYVNEATVVKSYAANGGLTDLGPYLDKFGPDLKAFYGEESLAGGQLDGKQFWLPGKAEVAAIHATYIRKDWVDKLGAQLPSTKAEFYELLKRFKEEDPGNVGKDKVIPWAFGGKARECYYENFVMSYADTSEKSNAVYSGILKMLTPGTKEAHRLLNTWYNEGLISPDFALDTSDKQFIQDITTGVAGAFTADQTEFIKYIEAFAGNVPDGEFWPIDCFENAEGIYYKDGDLGQSLKIMVPKSNEKNAEAAVRYLNWMADMKNLINISYGLEGVCFQYDEEGLPDQSFTTVDDRLAKGISDTMFSDLAIISRYIDFGSPEGNFKVYMKTIPKGHEALGEELYKVNYNAQGIYKRFDFTTPLEAEANYGATVKSSMRAATPKIISCKPADFDSVYESEVGKVMEGGAKAIIDERTAAFEELGK